MSEFDTRLMVSLTEREVEIILSRLDKEDQPARAIVNLIERLERRLSAREKELEDLKELMEGPDYQVGI